MSFTALDGLVMGTRCGAIDPGVLLYLMDDTAWTPRALERLLYEESGLLGVSGGSSDMRELLAARDAAAAEAVDLFVYRIDARARLARGGAGRARRPRVHGRHRRERADRSARASAARRAGSGSSSTRRPTRAGAPASAGRAAASRPG